MKYSACLTLFGIFVGFASCDHKSPSSESSEEPVASVPSMQDHYPIWSRNANMYEVNIRQYTEEGTIAAFERHVPRLKEMGVDILWLMPIYPISSTKKKGTLGSYYAVSDFTKVNPEFGDIDDVRSLVKTIHEAGMKIILDFVPNHTGWDHVWIHEHPEFYTKNEQGEIVDPQDPATGKSWGWTDVADLNFDNSIMRETMIDNLLYWIKNEHVDGFRMDIAHGVPVSFWKEVHTALTAVKQDVFMLAEAQVPALRDNSYFQCDYGWKLHHILNDVAKGHKGPKDIEDWYTSNQSEYSAGWHIQFTSNHDENSWAGTTEERMGDAHDALAALAYTIEGMPLVYGGQEEPLDKRLQFFEKDDIGFADYAKADWYKTMLKLKHDNEAIWNGEFGGVLEFLQVDEQILSYKRTKNEAALYSIFNLASTPSSFEITEDLAGYRDVFTSQPIQLSKGTKIELEGWSYLLYSKN